MNTELSVANNQGFIQSVINYADTHTPKYETELKPVERARIARYADIGGKIPFFGAVVGLARLVSSVVMGIIILVSMFLYPVNLCLLKPQRATVLLRYCEHVAMRAVDEGARGLFEFCTLGFDTFFIDRKQSVKEQSYGIIGQATRGKYVYVGGGGHFYSNSQFIGKANSVYSEKPMFDSMMIVEELQNKDDILGYKSLRISLKLFIISLRACFSLIASFDLSPCFQLPIFWRILPAPVLGPGLCLGVNPPCNRHRPFVIAGCRHG
jgi:hypothetical protein